jgi:hypothetical protein
MAYLRKEKEIVEIDFSLEKVWMAIPKAIADIEWTLEETDYAKHQLKARTKAGLMSYGSVFSIDALAVTESTTRVNVSAETPVTTVTAMVDFGRTRERIDLFLAALFKQLIAEKGKAEKAD